LTIDTNNKKIIRMEYTRSIHFDIAKKQLFSTLSNPKD